MVATIASPPTDTPAAEPTAPQQPRTLSSTYVKRERVDVSHDDLKEAGYNPAVAYATAAARRAVERHSARTEATRTAAPAAPADDDTDTDDEPDDEVGMATVDGQRVNATVTDSAGSTVRGDDTRGTVTERENEPEAGDEDTLSELMASARQLVEKLPASAQERLKGKSYGGATPIESFRMFLDDYYDEVQAATSRSAKREATRTANEAHEEQERERRARQRARGQESESAEWRRRMREAEQSLDIAAMDTLLKTMPKGVMEAIEREGKDRNARANAKRPGRR